MQYVLYIAIHETISTIKLCGNASMYSNIQSQYIAIIIYLGTPLPIPLLQLIHGHSMTNIQAVQRFLVKSEVPMALAQLHLLQDRWNIKKLPSAMGSMKG